MLIWVDTLAAVIAAVFGWQVWTWIRARTLYDMHKIPGPKGLPLLGNLHQIMGTYRMHRILEGWTRRYGSIVKLRLGLDTVLAITDPREVTRLCSREEDVPKWLAGYKVLKQRPPHYKLFATPDPGDWKHVRKTTNLAFSPNSIREAFPIIVEKVLKAADVMMELSKTGPFDVNAISSRMTAEILLKWAYDEQLEAMELKPAPNGRLELTGHPYLEHLKVQLQHMTRPFVSPFHDLLLKIAPWLQTGRRERFSVQAIEQKDNDLANMIKQRGRQPDSNTALWACLSRLVNYKDGSPMHPEQFASNTGFFLFAGHDTTANTITWALFELAADQEIQDELQKELMTAGLAPSPEQPEARPLEYTDLTKLALLEAVLKETMRLHPTAPMGTTRHAPKDMVVGGYRIPRGTVLIMPPFAMHTSAANFTNPDKFWPARWVTPTDKDDVSDTGHPDATPMGNRHNLSGSWNPFSSGPRNCIGQPLALTEIRTALAVLLSRFHFALPDGVQREEFIEENEVWWITLQLRHGLTLKVTPREQQGAAGPATPPQAQEEHQTPLLLCVL